MHFVWGVNNDSVDNAARIWANATAARDNDADAGPLALARHAITKALSEADEANLVLAFDDDGRALGFALTVASAHGVELYYLGVAPAVWGQGVATALLDEVARTVQGADARALELWVYADNERAIAVYERAGWHHDDLARVHRRSGRVELHYVRRVVGG